MMNKSRGRPPGRTDTRERIADAARALFLQRGYRGTTVRAIATAADVDSALIAYHFGSKQGLFAEAMNLHCTRSLVLSTALAGDPAALPERLLLLVTDMWDGVPLATGMPTDEVARVFREFLERELLDRLAEFLARDGGPDPTLRATAAVVVIAGLVFTRYLNPLRPASSTPSAEIRRALAPALRAALTGRASARRV